MAVTASLVSECSRQISPVQRGFYFWRTSFTLSPAERSCLDDLRIGTLYVRFFDVVWDAAERKALPQAKLVWRDKAGKLEKIVPVIYIVNAVFEQLPDGQVPALAQSVLRETAILAAEGGISPAGFQIDCDWTDATRTKYFRFLTLVRSSVRQSGQTVSATVRLHQVKYFRRTGIPPVDRGMLMFYNMGTMGRHSRENSIFNETDAKKYTASLGEYSLPLDAALPLFSWAIHFRDGAIVGLLPKTYRAELDSIGNLRKAADGLYLAQQPIFFHGRFLAENDELRVESATPAETAAAAALLASTLRRMSGLTITLFDLDEKNLTNFNREKLNAVFDRFGM